MGPRHLSRGIGLIHDREISWVTASMGPRHLSRGITDAQWADICGYFGFNGATAFEPWNPKIEPVQCPMSMVLQWGHGI